MRTVDLWFNFQEQKNRFLVQYNTININYGIGCTVLILIPYYTVFLLGGCACYPGIVLILPVYVQYTSNVIIIMCIFVLYVHVRTGRLF